MMKLRPYYLKNQLVDTLLRMDHSEELDAKCGLEPNQWLLTARRRQKLGAVLTLTMEQGQQSHLVAAVAFRFCLERLQQKLLDKLELAGAGAEGLSCDDEREVVATTEEALEHLLTEARSVVDYVMFHKDEFSEDELAASLPQAGPKVDEFATVFDRSHDADDLDPDLLDQLKAELDEESLDLSATESPTVVRQRIGQQRYRKALEQLWDGKCAVTGVSEPCLLRASHAMPWKECKTGKERLSPFNGFLLNVALDALFDKFLISFADDGSIMLAPSLKPEELAAVGITPEMRIEGIRSEHLPFLSYHRAQFYKKAQDQNGV